MNELSRRLFMTRLLQAGVTLSSAGLTKSAFAQTAFAGKFLVTVQCQGAWDVSSFCDPKMNIAGEKEINHWARTKSIGTAGRLRYAPFGINQRFFDKHYGKMLVINGVDMQTNAHETGETATWSGRLALGYPGLTSIYAATVAPDLALSSINLGGWNNTEGLITSTRISNPANIANPVFANRDLGNPSNPNPPGFIADSDLARVRALQMRDVQNMLTEQAAMPQDLQNRQNFINAVKNSEGLKAFAALIPRGSELKQPKNLTSKNIGSTIHQQVQMALLAFKSGLTVAADLKATGFDTHVDHDMDHEVLLADAMDAVDYLWDYAEQLGLADRLLVVMGSDFSRTPYYNGIDGKDHWAIGSYVIMEKNTAYTNRLVGETDGGQNAFKINPSTLVRDDSKGTLIYSKHVHKALRRYLGIENSAASRLFPFNSTEDFRFFG